jgi:hypothetical protein
VIFEMADRYSRSFHFDNCYVKNADRAWTESARCNRSGWTRFRRLAVHVKPQETKSGPVSEQIYVDGTPYGDIYVDSVNGEGPPQDLQSRHRWPPGFPTWETPGAANVKTDYGAAGDGSTDDWAAIQRAIDENEVVFFPKGTYMISKTLELRSDSKLIGVWHKFSCIMALASTVDLFDDATNGESESRPMIRTVDSADAETCLAFLHVRRAWPLAQHNPVSPANYALEWRCAGNSVVRHVEFHARPQSNCRSDYIAHYFYGYPDSFKPDCRYPQDDFADGQYAWPNEWPVVQVRGNGGGRWFNFWYHGRSGSREWVPLFRAEDTSRPLHIYHMHMQQQDSWNHAEFVNADNVTVYGNKGEIKATMVFFNGCDNVRLYGYGGLGTPDPHHPHDPEGGDEHLYFFKDCTNFLIAGIGDDVRHEDDRWIGGCYDQWVNAKLGTWHAIGDHSSSRSDVDVDPMTRPAVYLRGKPRGLPAGRDR